MVHQYKLNGYNIVIDVCSGGVHVVDDIAYDVIEMYKTHSPEEIVAAMLEKYSHLPDVNESEILECIDDIHSLVRHGENSVTTLNLEGHSHILKKVYCIRWHKL